MTINLSACCEVENLSQNFPRPAVTSPDEAKDLLIKGNSEYLTNDKDAALRLELSAYGQHPYAVVIT